MTVGAAILGTRITVEEVAAAPTMVVATDTKKTTAAPTMVVAAGLEDLEAAAGAPAVVGGGY